MRTATWRKDRLFALVALTTAAVSLPQFARAQFAVSALAGLIDLVDGAVYVDDAPLTLPAGGTLQLRDGERVRTDKGMLEMAVGTNIGLWLGEASALTLIESRLSSAMAVLERGSAVVEVSEEIEGIQLSVRVGESVALWGAF